MTKNPLKAVVGADRDAYFWIKKKFGLGEYQMGALIWFSGLIIGILLGVWIGRTVALDGATDRHPMGGVLRSISAAGPDLAALTQLRDKAMVVPIRSSVY